MFTIICAHCGETFQSRATNAKYCKKKECQTAKDRKTIAKRLKERNLYYRHCSDCKRTFLVEKTSKETRCKKCRELYKQNGEPKMCECCGVRHVHPGFRKLCYECWKNDGPPDETPKGESLEYRHAKND